MAYVGGSGPGGRSYEQGRHASQMDQDKATKPMRPGASKDGKRPSPEWADGLRQLYDSVVNEPLPDSFADLLSKLDDNSK